MTPTSRPRPIRAAYDSGTVEKRNAAASRCEMRHPSMSTLPHAGTR